MKGHWPTLTPFQIINKVAVEKETPSVDGVDPRIGNICAKCFKTIETRPSIQMILQDIIQAMKSM